MVKDGDRRMVEPANTAELTEAVLLAASEIGARLHRNNSGSAMREHNGKVRRIRFGVGPVGGGGGDLIGWCRGGRFASIEIKFGRDKQTDAQKKWERWVIMGGGVAGVARSVADAMAILEGGAEPRN